MNVLPISRGASVRTRARITALMIVAIATAGMVRGVGGPPVALAATTTTPLNYQCSLTEPFAAFAVDGATILWLEPNDTAPRRFLLGSLSRSADGRFAAQTVQGPKDLKAFVITSQPGSDGASDRVFGSTLEVVTPRSHVGACSRLPFTYQAHVVTGVAAGDNLNVRSSPSIRGRILARVAPLGLVWTTGKQRNGWVSVGVIVFPGGDRGPAKIVEGWVNARFLNNA